MSIVVTTLTVLNGFLEVDQDKIKLIETFGGSKRDILTKVMLPANVPTMINALKVNVGLSCGCYGRRILSRSSRLGISYYLWKPNF